MIFKELPLKGSYIIELDKKEDNRGFFARTFDVEEFKKYDINFNIVQTSISSNTKKGTLRGMHYQDSPYEESKLIQCMKGSIYDVILDIRKTSRTKGMWASVTLTHKNNKMIFIPKGMAHGFQTLTNDTTVLYYTDEFYHPECSKTICYNSTEYNMKWVAGLPIVISEKDNCA